MTACAAQGARAPLTRASRRALRSSWLLAALLVGCRAPVHRLDFVLQGSGEAEVLVLGERLHLEFENDGPGAVELLIEASAGVPEQVALGRARWMASMRGPVRISCRNTEDLIAHVHLRADGADGIALEQTTNAPGGSPSNGE